MWHNELERINRGLGDVVGRAHVIGQDQGPQFGFVANPSFSTAPGAGAAPQLPNSIKGFMDMFQQGQGQQPNALGSPGPVTGLTGQPAKAQNVAMTQLLELLLGTNDPRQANIQRADISRGGQQQTSDLRGELARTGIGGLNSGVAQALLGASGGATQDRLARFEANEAQDQRQRQIQALQLFMDLVQGPALQQQGIQAGIDINNQNRKDQRSAARDARNAELLNTAGRIGLGLATGGTSEIFRALF